jgi:hypothetical protein
MPQATNRRGTIGVSKNKIVIGLPFTVSAPGEGKVVCTQTDIIERLCRASETVPDQVIEEIREFFTDLEDYIDKTARGLYSIELPLIMFMVEDRRNEVAKKLQVILEKLGIQADVHNLDADPLQVALAR